MQSVNQFVFNTVGEITADLCLYIFFSRIKKNSNPSFLIFPFMKTYCKLNFTTLFINKNDNIHKNEDQEVR